MAITTKKGDAGISHWLGRAVGKDDVLIEAIGSLDELQAAIGVSGLDLPEVMTDMWGIMGEVGMGVKYDRLEERVELMESEIERMENELPQLTGFLIFTKIKAAQLNWVRTMVRRSERRLVALSKKEDVSPKLLAYINRLSDYLFMLARIAENE